MSSGDYVTRVWLPSGSPLTTSPVTSLVRLTSHTGEPPTGWCPGVSSPGAPLLPRPPSLPLLIVCCSPVLFILWLSCSISTSFYHSLLFVCFFLLIPSVSPFYLILLSSADCSSFSFFSCTLLLFCLLLDTLASPPHPPPYRPLGFSSLLLLSLHLHCFDQGWNGSLLKVQCYPT